MTQLSRLDQAHELVDAIQRLSLARSIPEIQEIVRTAARRLTGADGATFVLRDGDHCHYADEDAISPLWKGQRFPLNTCISGWAMLNRRPAVIEDIYADDRIPHEAYRPTFVKSLAMVPIRTLDPVGAIGNYWAERHEPTDAEIELLQALADSTAVAMESVRVYPGKLTLAEFEVIKGHAAAGADILSGSTSDVLRKGEEIALTHHEWWNGSGYPMGLRGDAIPLSGRIVALADVFDALTHQRPYKHAWPLDRAVAEIARLTGSQFDPAVAAVFEQLDPRELVSRIGPRG